MNPYQLHPNPYSGPILLIVMTFLGLAAQMTNYFCKQLAFFLIMYKIFYLEAHPLQLAWAKSYTHCVICSGVVTFLQCGPVAGLDGYNVVNRPVVKLTRCISRVSNWWNCFPNSITEFI